MNHDIIDSQASYEDLNEILSYWFTVDSYKK